MSTSLGRSAKKESKAVDPNLSHDDVNIVKKKTRRARKSVPETVPYIPGTVIHDILVRSSATFVNNCRLVSKEWRDIISRKDFIAKNFKYSESLLQLLLQCPTSNKRTYFDVKIMKFDDNNRVCKLSTFDLPKTGQIRTSCHGLLLADIPNNPNFLRLLNPVTKKQITLPKYPSYCPYKACSAALVLDPLTKLFKVVYMYTPGACFEILTLDGQENTWKRVFVQWKGSVPDLFFILRDPIVSENGRVLHWNVQSHKYILSMDIAEEKPVVTFLPEGGLTMFTGWRYILVEMEGRVAVVYYDSIGLFCVWVLIDFRASVWDQIDGVRAVCRLALKRVAPVGSMENGRYLVFKHDQTDEDGGALYLYIYDMNTREMKNRYKINKKMKNMECLFTYRSSLIDWNTFRDQQVNTD